VRTFTCLLLFVIGGEQLTPAQNQAQSDLKKLTLEELMDVNVNAVSRKEEPLGPTPAAVTVITAEDIRRSGVTSIPEALRLVPGVQVARINASSWAISARGFNTQVSNKMLVQIDGRTVYSPIFGGVFWELQDLVLDDIARIEVVRGPGATLWGTNAVNGIVNIITKSAHQTKSTAIVLTGGGADDLGLASFRTGGALTPDTSYRVASKYFYRDEMVLPTGSESKDSSRFARTRFRIDSTQGANEWTLEGDVFRGFEGLLGRPDAKLLGGDVLARWSRKISNDSSIQIQASYDRLLQRETFNSDIRQRMANVDLQHQFAVGRHNVIWGGGYRWQGDTNFPMPLIRLVPAKRAYPLETAFIQDEISLSQNRLKLEIGSKFERNDFTGFEMQPSIRTSWAIHPDEFIWGAVSRAVRTPTRFDTDTEVTFPGVRLLGNPNFKSEAVVAFESGYRSRIARRLSMDVATFFNIYDNLRNTEPRGAPEVFMFFNNLNAKTYGGELSASYDVLDRLRITANYSYLGKHLRLEPGHFDIFGTQLEGNDAKHSFQVRGSADLPHRVEIDSAVRFVSRLPLPSIPGYFEFDSRLAWLPDPRVELSIIGRNLLHTHHPEFNQPLPTPPEEVQRNVYGRVALRF